MPGKDETPHTSHITDLHAMLHQIILESDHLIVFCTDDTGKILTWNHAAEITTGYSQEEIPDLETAFRYIYPDGTYRAIITTVRDSFKKNKNKSVYSETKIKTKNGQIRYISLNTQQISVKNKPTQQLFITLGADITHARQNERDALLLGEIVTSSHDAIGSISTDGIILTWNNAAENIFGYGEMDSIGKPFARHIPEENRDYMASILSDVITGQDFKGNIECLTKTRDIITLNVTFSPISGEDGTIEGISAIMRDMTRELSLQQTMEEYITEATMRLNHPAALVEGNLTSLIERIRNGEIDNEEILIELQVQNKALSQIVYNLRELSQAVIGHFKESEGEIVPDTIQ
ncbi:PAS domain-containing protein [Methanogenium organophilum]|uniref:PAS domain-containing protein n=1 Tax=Methanogenium organophilum TaxID=2199 RepID=A0A9X9T7C9_METOG|nr:PAS domain-containing protein [Methanogenium organophilum]WAI00939.1 PAS domain-containing protein [Methanogenium organophilum]